MITNEQVQEWIFTAVQSGKKETSGLVDHLERVMDKRIGEAVDKYVNGHMRDMKKDVDGIKEHLEAQDEILADLKRDTAPVVEAQKTTRSIGKFIMWTGGIAGSIWGLIKLVTSFK